MIHLDDIADAANINAHVQQGHIAEVHHPTEPLTLYNYTQACQWAGAWDHETRLCRGLIVNSATGEVVARPFPKFHNLHEHGPESTAGPITLIPPIRLFDKVDGSLGIAYRQPSDGRIAWATRGSFTSDQSRWATNWWNENHLDHALPEGVTVLAEIVYPENRIVVDYGNQSGLVLLAALDNANGTHLAPLGKTMVDWWPADIVVRHGTVDDATDIDPNDRTGVEGYVALSADGRTRVKLKADEYVRLHKIVTGVSTVTIWEMLRHGDDLTQLVEGVPDEFMAWVDATITDLNGRYRGMQADAIADYEAIAHLASDRKAFATEAMKSPHRPLLFALLDGKTYSDMIWRQIKPERELPFSTRKEDDQ